DAVDLFRRAVAGDDRACEDVLARYGRLVLAWMRRVPAAAGAAGDERDPVARAFDRFWRALRGGRLSPLEGLPAMLGYLKLCAARVALDDARHRARRPEGDSLEL